MEFVKIAFAEGSPGGKGLGNQPRRANILVARTCLINAEEKQLKKYDSYNERPQKLIALCEKLYSETQ